MLPEKTARIVDMIQKNRGINGRRDREISVKPELKETRHNQIRSSSNFDLILPLAVNANALGLGGFQSSMLVTLVNLIMESDTNLLPPSLKELAGKASIGVSTLERHIAQLKELDLITVDKTLDDRGFARNIYRFEGLKDKLRGLGVDI